MDQLFWVPMNIDQSLKYFVATKGMSLLCCSFQINQEYYAASNHSLQETNLSYTLKF